MRRLAATIILLGMVQCEKQSTETTAPAASGAEAHGSAAAAEEPTGAPARPQKRPTAPKGFVEVSVKAVIPTLQGNAVMLVDEQARRALLVFVGDTEALSIHLRLEREQYKRPLTHDLFDDVLGGLGARVHSVRVDRLDDDVFYGVVTIEKDQTRRDYDSRTSDAIALALGNNAPVFVAREVLNRASVKLDESGMPSAAASVPTDPGKSPISL